MNEFAVAWRHIHKYVTVNIHVGICMCIRSSSIRVIECFHSSIAGHINIHLSRSIHIYTSSRDGFGICIGDGVCSHYV